MAVGRVRLAALVAVVGATLAVSSARADEGMWLLTKPPMGVLKERYGFEPDAAWLERMQKSAVRMNVGGSASLVSKDGLVMTNHHVASDTIAKLSTRENNLMRNGFLARSRAEELKCPDLEVNVLWKITDVTARVKAAAAKTGVGTGSALAVAGRAQREEIAAIEKQATDESGLQSEVVTLYNGGQYHLYQYKRYTDVRLVFAPEETIAFFGGDTDNFEYPRFNLDVSFFRIYENDKPIAPEHYLKWSGGAAENDLAIVFGYPGRTRRGFTGDHVKWLRDVDTPRRLARLWRSEIKAQTFAGRSAEHARVVREDLFGVANGRKAVTGIFSGLAEHAVIEAKIKADEAVHASIATNASMSPTERQAVLGAFDDIAKSLKVATEIGPRMMVLNAGAGGEYASMAMQIVRLAAELPKPSAERLREYGDARLESLYQSLYSPAPIYDFYEVYKVEQTLLHAVELLGGEDPLARVLLADKSPRERAEELVNGVTFKTPEARKALVEGGAKALAEAIKNDPMLALAAMIDEEAREVRKRNDDEVDSVQRDAYARIAAARFALLGDSVYPDATFTLRMSFGPIKGFVEDGANVPAFTTIGGVFTRYDERKGQDGFELPESWLSKRAAMSAATLNTPFNFICTADIIGGNSGSPVVNRAGEVIGLIFDGNIHSLVADIQYAGDGKGRAVAVDSRAIVEALRVVYGADALAAEITGK
jgi:hypothetical protein